MKFRPIKSFVCRSAETGETSLQLHRPDRDGNPVCTEQEADALGDLPVPPGVGRRAVLNIYCKIIFAAKVSVLPRLVPGLEELCAPQPVAQ